MKDKVSKFGLWFGIVCLAIPITLIIIILVVGLTGSEPKSLSTITKPLSYISNARIVIYLFALATLILGIISLIRKKMLIGLFAIISALILTIFIYSIRFIDYPWGY